MKIQFDVSLGRRLAETPLDLADLEAVRLVMRGNSVIDWTRVHFRSYAEVDQFLALQLMDPADPVDAARLRYVHVEAIQYLEEHLGLQFPEDLRHPVDVRDIFIHASQTGGFRRKQILSCVILKLMHVVNHMEAAELRFHTPLSDFELMDLAERRILSAAERLRAEGFPLVGFYGSRKERHSVITKLLAKRDTTASPIFDKLRFRVVTEGRQHVLGAIRWLQHNLFTVNHVLPGQSHNNLIPLGALLRSPSYAEFANQLQGWSVEDEDGDMNPEQNPFSGASYRMVNFITDFPVRVDHLVDVSRYATTLGRSVFVMVEFQVLDQETSDANELGENAHELYKERQRAIVAARLRKGARWKRRDQE